MALMIDPLGWVAGETRRPACMAVILWQVCSSI